MQASANFETEQTPFQRATHTTCVAAGQYRCTIHDDWSMDRGPNGGYLAAILLDALLPNVPAQAQSVCAYAVRFLAAAKPGPAEIRTRVDRAGQSMTWLSGELWQGERLCMTSSVAASAPRPSLEYEPRQPPTCLPPVQQVEPLVVPHMPPITRHYEYRSLHATPVAPCSDDRVGGFVRLREPQRVDLPLLTALADAWFPASYARHPRTIFGSTVELTLYFRNHAALSALPGDAYLYTVFSSRQASEGFVDEDGEIWSEDGKLLAQSRQLRIASALG